MRAKATVRDHRALIAALDADERAELTSRSDAPGLLRLALHLGAIAALAAAVAAGVPGWPFLMLPLGVLTVFLFTLLHETVHGTAFRTPWLNELVARFCGLVLLLPAEWFRFFHFAHHRHTQDPARDPELATPKPSTRGDYVLHVSGLRVWQGQLTTLFTNAAGRCRDEFVPAAARPRVAREARLMIGVYAALLALSFYISSSVLVFVWLLPLLFGQPFLRLYLLAEHGRCAFVANMLENTRTTYTNVIVRWLAWNMPYHAEHHAYPMVPFHKLPAFHRLAQAHLRVTERGYVRFNRRYLSEVALAAPAAAPDRTGRAG